MGRGECQDFPVKTSCLTVPKNLVGQPFRLSLISGIEKLYASGAYFTIFCRNFLSHSAERFCRGPISVSLVSGIRKVWMRGWGGRVKFFQ